MVKMKEEELWESIGRMQLDIPENLREDFNNVATEIFFMAHRREGDNTDVEDVMKLVVDLLNKKEVQP